MQRISKFTYYTFWLLFLVTLYAFLKMLNDAMDIDWMGISRSRSLNHFIPFILLPAAVVLFAFWFDQVIKVFNKIPKGNKIPSGFMSLLWWIPIYHFAGPSSLLTSLDNKIVYSDLIDNSRKKFSNGKSWLTISYIIFYTLFLLAYAYYFFMETNKDGHDFFISTLLLFILIWCIGVIKMSKAFTP